MDIIFVDKPPVRDPNKQERAAVAQTPPPLRRKLHNFSHYQLLWRVAPLNHLKLGPQEEVPWGLERTGQKWRYRGHHHGQKQLISTDYPGPHQQVAWPAGSQRRGKHLPRSQGSQTGQTRVLHRLFAMSIDVGSFNALRLRFLRFQHKEYIRTLEEC